MSEPVEERFNEEGAEIETGCRDDNWMPNAAFLVELNMVLILSFLSLSAEEALSFEETATASKNKVSEAATKIKHRGRDHQARKASSLPRLQTRRREASDFRLIANRDCRHCRRM